VRLLLLPALICAGCALPPEARDEDPFARGLWPLVTGDRRPWAGVRERKALGPLLHWEAEGPGDSPGLAQSLALRPLYSFRREVESRRHDLLYPLAGWSLRPEREQGSFLWLARVRDDPGDGSRESVLGLGYRGRSESGTPYSGLFPLSGSFADRFGNDRTTFRLWPLYARVERGAYREVQILWPFFAYGRGPDRFRLKIWPLFGVSRREGVEVRRFYLWPFVHHRVRRLDTETPERSFYILPFYGRRDRGFVHMRFWLFPLLARQWDDTHPEVHRTDLLWPFHSRGRDRKGNSFFALRPLFGRSRGPDHSGWSLGLGLLGRTAVRKPELEETSWRVLWVGRTAARREDGREVRHAALWPLFHLHDGWEADGTRSGYLRVPFLLPFRGLEPDGWDRHYNKLFEIYGARWHGGERRSTFLFGLREARISPLEHWVSWGGLLHLRR
jgi:hypothetical protein